MEEKISGKGAVGIAIAYYSLRGMVSIPLSPCAYNLLFDDGKDIYKINVISCSYKTKYGVYTAAIRTMGGNHPGQVCKKFDPSTCDIVFIVNNDFDIFAIPSSEIKSERQISLSVYEEYKIRFLGGIA